jgi:hypothetical protein
MTGCVAGEIKLYMMYDDDDVRYHDMIANAQGSKFSPLAVQLLATGSHAHAN